MGLFGGFKSRKSCVAKKKLKKNCPNVLVLMCGMRRILDSEEWSNVDGKYT